MLAHVWLETAAFAVGGFLYWRNGANRADGDASPQASSHVGTNTAVRHEAVHTLAPPDKISRLAIVAGAVLGAAMGSRLLYVFQYWIALSEQPWQVWLGGKTIVGALLGGLIGVEVAKLAIGWKTSTGNGFVTPLLVAIAIGRIGCQLSGLSDLTYGNVTTLPWAWDYGDGLPRHPTSFYEIVGLAAISATVRRPLFEREPGDRFRVFMICYLLMRMGLEVLKPPFGPAAAGTLAPNFLGPLTPIQWACVAGLAYYFPTIRRWLRRNA